jgi:hypothetical protein
MLVVHLKMLHANGLLQDTATDIRATIHMRIVGHTHLALGAVPLRVELLARDVIVKDHFRALEVPLPRPKGTDHRHHQRDATSNQNAKTK